MSRLDSMIRRLTAQRQCLDLACEMIQDVEGAIFEVGLGNGRTFDHLREHLPDREIYIFDREIKSHPDSRPEPGHAFLGAIEETLPKAARQFAGRVALLHSDIGNGISEYGRRMAGEIGRTLMTALAPGAVVLSDEELDVSGLEVVPPPLTDLRRYYMYRRPL
ncbi:MAG: class I SAM-dependent methyltransferase [Hyphomicrobiaceae bacterium]